MTKRGVVRDFMTVITDQKELHQQLLKSGMIKYPTLTKEVYSNSLFWLKYSENARKSIGKAEEQIDSLWGAYREKTLQLADIMIQNKEEKV